MSAIHLFDQYLTDIYLIVINAIRKQEKSKRLDELKHFK
jgi:hypothetical protein